MEVSKKRDRPEIDLPIIDCPEYMIVPEALSSRSRSKCRSRFSVGKIIRPGGLREAASKRRCKNTPPLWGVASPAPVDPPRRFRARPVGVRPQSQNTDAHRKSSALV